MQYQCGVLLTLLRPRATATTGNGGDGQPYRFFWSLVFGSQKGGCRLGFCKYVGGIASMHVDYSPE